MPLISVIVPVYNAEASLSQCIESILAQTFSDFEILLIDDGSTDGSERICDTYAAKDNRIRVIHKKNEGVSAARQTGVEQAKGVYSIHVDSDDFVDLCMLEDMYREIINDNADMVIADIYDGAVYRRQSPVSLSPEQIIRDILTGRIYGATWNKLIKHSVYREYSIRFPKDINYCEDALTIIRILLTMPKVKHLPQAYYHYNCPVESLTNTFSKKQFLYRFAYIKELKGILLSPDYNQAICETMLYIKKDAFYSNLFTPKELKELYPECRKQIFHSSFRFRLKLILFLSSYGLSNLAQILGRRRDYR